MPDIQLKYKPDFSRAQLYWNALWEHEIVDRPCAVVWAKGKDAADEAPRTVSVDADFNSVFEVHDHYLETNHFLGECMPGFRPGFGPDQFAGFLGAPLLMSDNSSDTSWSQKIVEDWKLFLPLEIEKQGKNWNRMKEFHRTAAEHFKGRCLLYNSDLHSNIDALEGLRGAERLLFDILDAPDVVMEAMRQVRRLHGEIFNEFYQYGDKINLGTASWLHFYCKGKYGVIQSDFICLLTPEMFKKFALPAIEEEAQFLDRSCFHLDGPGALTHLSDILAIKKIDAIQWVPGVGNKSQLEWTELLNRIQAAGKIVVLYGSVDEIKAIHGRFKPELVVYDVQAQSKDEGIQFLEWLKKNT